ncbi:MAG: substrate-binding domain-containing protein [Oscillospiraceae bacterium]|nr:substrate-binding domain-containing protein [Oscillospiraceae bacterium]
MKKMITVCVAAALMMSALAGCSGTTTSSSAATPTTSTPASSAQSSQAESNFDTSKNIAVISREDGSGTRGAFVELFGVEEKDADGNKVDRTSEEADITNSTSVMMTSVAGNTYAIGYISLGSLNDTVKAVKIDGAEASVENIKNGTYGISRPFNIATKAEVSEVAQDFIDFIMSSDGQAVVEGAGYIPQETSAAYAGSKPSGKIVVAGSSSVTPVMEKLKEAYLAVNPNAEIEVQQSDSTTGMTSAIDGICDIGMASRELKDTEIEKGLTATVIATDGIAVVVNNDNPIENLTKDQVKSIYVGETLAWSEVA